MYIVRWHVPVKVMNLFCQDKTLLTRREGLSLTASNICANGPVVGLVAVRVRAGMSFCIVPVESRKHARQGISVIGTLKVDEQELSRHNKVI